MAHKAGRLGKVAVSAAGSVYTDVGGVFSAEATTNHDQIDATDFDSLGYKEQQYGETQVSFNVQFHRDEADAGQDIIRTAAQGKSALYIRYRQEETAGAKQITAQVTINSLNDSNARNQLVDQTLDAISTGTPTFDTQ
jgi:hypothetical protein